MSHVVYSTLSADTAYTSYVYSDNHPMVEKTVTIQGGAKVATKALLTPRGLVTHISDSDLEHLEKNPVFKMHVENGYIHVEKKEVKLDKVVDDMEKEDESAPITPEYLEEKKLAKPQKGKA